MKSFPETSTIRKLTCLVIFIFTLLPVSVELQAQHSQELDLFRCIQIASDSSLQAFIAENYYQSGYWEYRSYKAANLPSLSLALAPLQYNRNIVKRYDYDANIDVYRTQQSLFSSGELKLSQQVYPTGGTFFIDSELGYMNNFGESAYSQFSSVPVRIGYSQSLFGFNSFKWEHKIEPLKFEKVKKRFIYHQQEIAENTVLVFFNLALAEKEYELARENMLTTDTLYHIALEREKISAISHADVLTLKLDWINAQNSLKNIELSLKDARFAFATFLNMKNDREYAIRLPEKTGSILIPVDDALVYAQNNNPDYLSYEQEILENEREVDRNKKRSVFDANISASIGFNQVAEDFSGAYQKPLQQDMFLITLSIPILDWGIRKGRLNMAKNNLEITKFSIQQKKQSLEQEIISAIDQFNVKQELILSAQEALSLANEAYRINKERFIVGKTDISNLTLSLNRYKEAQRNYINSLKYYWLSYFRIKKLTLYDFEAQKELSALFDNELITF